MRTLLLVELRLTPMPVGEPSSQAESGKSIQVQVPGVAWMAVGPASAPPASGGRASALEPGASGVEMGASAPPEVPLSLQPPVASPVATTMLRMPGNAGAIFMGRKLTGRWTETQTSRDRHRASWRAGARSWVGRHPRQVGDLDPVEPGPER